MKLIRKYSILALVLLPLITSAEKATYDFNQRCLTAYTDILSLDFKTALTKLDQEKAQSPNNRIPLLLENYIDFFTLILGEQKSDFERLKENKSKRIEAFSKAEAASPWFHYSLAAVNLQWAFGRMRYGEYISAGADLSSASRIINKNKELFPDFLPNKLISGVLNVVVGSVPESYRWPLRLAGLSGNAEQGRKELYAVLSEAERNPQWAHLRPEALFYLVFIESGMQSNKEVMRTLFQRLQQSPDQNNLLICNLKTTLARRLGYNDQVVSIIDQCISLPGSFQLPYTEYYGGIARLNRLDKEAAGYFLKFIANRKGTNYIKSAYQRLAWLELINGNHSKYRFYIGKASTEGTADIDEDRQAMKEATERLIPTVALLKARLLSDGGYYEKAQALLITEVRPADLPTLRDSIEYHFRLGRISQEQGKTTVALGYFNKTISQGKNSGNYLAANALLQAGIISENLKDYAKARLYYQQCLDMNFDEYRRNITQRARSGLDRVKGKK